MKSKNHSKTPFRCLKNSPDCGVYCSPVRNMTLYGMTELATRNLSGKELVDRSDSPRDAPTRRPSHQDRRNFLRRGMLLNDFKF